VAAFHRRGVVLPPPVVVADSWFSDSKLMRHVATTHQGTFLVEGKSTYIFALPDGRQVKGHDFQKPGDWPWRQSPQVPGERYARLRATSPTYGAVTVIMVDGPGADQFYLMCLELDFGHSSRNEILGKIAADEGLMAGAWEAESFRDVYRPTRLHRISALHRPGLA
jgi:hypothetical protein